MTNNNSSGSLSPSAKFVDTYIAAGGLSWVAKRIWNDALALEVEGVGAKYFGDQGNWEFDFSLAGRWKKFPWNETVGTTLAWGVGPSYATEIPKTEAANHHGTSKQWLVFWFGEVTVGPPKSKWAAVFRLHHRSPGYGLFGTTGGSNTPSLGLKFFF